MEVHLRGLHVAVGADRRVAGRRAEGLVRPQGERALDEVAELPDVAEPRPL